MLKQEHLIAEQMSEQLLKIDNLESEEITWNQALHLMVSNNIDILNSKDQIINSEESLRQIYLDLLPGASISASVSRALTDFANLNSNDFALNVFSFINLPGVLSQHIRYYARALELMRARWAYELKIREQTIALYEQFLQYQLLIDRINSLTFSSRFQASSNILTGLDTTLEGLQREELALTLENQSRGMQASISRLLGTSRSKWVLDHESLPVWDYVKKPLPVNDLEKFGTLYRQLQALQLEGMRLSKRGVQFNYWPDLRISVLTPPIYTVQQGSSSGVDIDRILVSLNTNIQLDTNLRIWTQLKQLERRIDLDKRRLEQENAILVQQLRTNQNALELNQKQIRLNDIRIRFLRQEERSLDPRKNRDQVERSIGLSEQRTTLLIEQARLQASLWLLDERRWDRVNWDEPEKKVRKR